MIFPQVSIKEWLTRFPQLKRPFIEICEDYALDQSKAKAFITNKKIGILINPDEPGRPITVNSFRNNIINNELTSIMLKLLH